MNINKLLLIIFFNTVFLYGCSSTSNITIAQKIKQCNKNEVLFYQRKTYKSTDLLFKEFSKFVLLRTYQEEFMPRNINGLIVGIGSDKKFDISPLSKLSQLDALGIYARNVDLSKIPQDVKLLVLSKIQLESLATLPNMPKVKFLCLSKITDKVKWSEFFAKFPNLKVLYWQSPPEGIKLKVQFLPKLEILVVRRFNKISLSPNLQLKGLALSLCQNTSLPDIKELKIQELVIKNSSKLKNYSSIPSLTSLKRLIINKAPLNSLDFMKGMKLEYLDISKTPVAKLPLPKELKVKHLIKNGSS